MTKGKSGRAKPPTKNAQHQAAHRARVARDLERGRAAVQLIDDLQAVMTAAAIAGVEIAKAVRRSEASETVAALVKHLYSAQQKAAREQKREVQKQKALT